MQVIQSHTQRIARVDDQANNADDQLALRARLLGLIVRNEKERAKERGKECVAERATAR